MDLQLFDSERKFAGTVIKVDDVVVAKITSFSRSLDIGEQDVTGSEDVVDGGSILRQQFIATQVSETASIEGIAIAGDTGQSDLSDAAETGATVVLNQTDADGNGYAMTGYFTSYEESGSVSDGVYTFSGEFRVNSKTPVVGS